MDFEGPLTLLALLLHWRVLLCTVASTGGAFLLVANLPWLTGLQGIALAVLGIGSGIAWNEKSWSKATTSTTTVGETKTAVAMTSAVLAATAWGAISSMSLHTALAGAAIHAAAIWAWSHIARRHFNMRPRTIALCIASAAAAYPIAALVAHNAA